MKSSLIRSTSVIALLAAPVTAGAQDILDAGEFVISASQTPVEAERTGATVDVEDGEDLVVEAPAKVADGLAKLPGVTTSANGGLGASTSLRIRGLPDRYIAVRLNGIDITDPSSVQTQLNWGSLAASGISRIEVLKGSQSALFGSEAIGGVVSLYSPRPTEIGTTVTTEFEFGSFDTVRAAFGVATKGERGEVSFSLAHINTDGFSTADENNGNTEADGYEGTTALFSAAYDATDSLRLGVDVIYQDERTDIDGFSFVTNSPTDDARPFFTDRRGARVWAQLSFGAWEHELSVSRFETDRRDVLTPFGSPRFVGERDEIVYKASADLGRTRITLGADYSEETATSSAGTFGYDVFSVFGEAQVAVTDALDISTALRIDDHSEFGTEPSGRVALAWRPNQDTVVRTAISTGFRAPSLNELFGPFNAAPPTLEPETSRSFELGVTRNLNNGVVEATAFYTEIDDLIDFVFPAGYTQVAGTSVTQGIELSGQFDISDSVSLFTAYTYTDAEDASGAQLLRVPHHDLVLGLDAEFGRGWSGQVSLQHIADRADEGGQPMSDYTLVNAAVRYQINDTTEAYLRIENLTDEEYQTARGFGTSDRAAYFGIRASF